MTARAYFKPGKVELHSDTSGFIPTEKFVLVRLEDKKQVGNIILPDNAKEKPTSGICVAGEYSGDRVYEKEKE